MATDKPDLRDDLHALDSAVYHIEEAVEYLERVALLRGAEIVDELRSSAQRIETLRGDIAADLRRA